MEFLDLQIDETDAIKRTVKTYDFPVVTFHKNGTIFAASFNRHARKALDNCEHVKIFANAEYIVFQPTDRKGPHTYKISYPPRGGGTLHCQKLERFVLYGKTFKLYSTQKGLAIKLSEPIQVRK